MKKNIKLESLQSAFFNSKAQNFIIGGGKWTLNPPVGAGKPFVATPPPQGLTCAMTYGEGGHANDSTVD